MGEYDTVGDYAEMIALSASDINLSFGTDIILKDISFDFDSGIEYLHRMFFQEKCSLAELKSYAESFLLLYSKRKTEHTEVCLICLSVVMMISWEVKPIQADIVDAIMNLKKEQNLEQYRLAMMKKKMENEQNGKMKLFEGML